MSPNRHEHPTDSSRLYRSRRLSEIAARWDAKARSWDAELNDPACHLNEDGAYERFLAQLTLAVGQRRQFCARQGAIDAGCATGLVLEKMLSSFAWGIGVDISPGMIRLANEKRLAGAKFLVGDCFELHNLCPKAGVIFSRGVLLSHYGYQHGVDLLRSAREVMVPGGFGLWDFLSQGGRDNAQHAPANKTYFETKQICDIAYAAGFTKARILTEPDRRVGILLAELG